MIEADENVVFFPSCGWRWKQGAEWQLPVRGWIFEPELDSRKRRALVGSLRRLLNLRGEKVDREAFRSRVHALLVDNQGGREIALQVVGETWRGLPPSRSNGHFRGRLPHRMASAAVRGVGPGAPRLSFHAAAPGEDGRRFPGHVFLPGERGFSVISDIDDTLKVSGVRDRKELLRNTFLRPFRAVPGMAARYRSWAEQGAMFHYLSASPWLLYPELASFLGHEGFPEGSWHLKLVRAKDTTILELFAAPTTFKPRLMRPLLRVYPNRRFVLVGDSGEQDPEVYAAMAEEFGEQVAAVLIRNDRGDPSEVERCRLLFERLPHVYWQVYDDAGELPVDLSETLGARG